MNDKQVYLLIIDRLREAIELLSEKIPVDFIGAKCKQEIHTSMYAVRVLADNLREPRDEDYKK